MVVLNMGDEEMELIEQGLELLHTQCNDAVANCDGNKKGELLRKRARVRCISKQLVDLRLQELSERCMAYFWDMYLDTGVMCDELEDMADDMGITVDEIVELFREAGFNE